MSTVRTQSRITGPEAPLPFETGDRMTQAEFHRCYEQCPPHIKAELIGGIVYMASPLARSHGLGHSEILGPFWLYKARTPGVEVLDNATTILSEQSEPQPDVTMRVLPEWGGRSSNTPDNYVKGPAELIAEVAASTRSLALHRKKADYEAAGVVEYLVMCVKEKELFWFDFVGNSEVKPNREGIHRSRVFPGLWLDEKALLAQDSLRAIEVVERGLASKEHAAFVKRLEAARKKLAQK